MFVKTRKKPTDVRYETVKRYVEFFVQNHLFTELSSLEPSFENRLKNTFSFPIEIKKKTPYTSRSFSYDLVFDNEYGEKKVLMVTIEETTCL